jgi:hypothetical protein
MHKVKEAHVNKILKIINDPNNRMSEINNISSAAAGLLGWA